MKLNKRLAKLHSEALALARSGRSLSCEEREFVLTHYHEGAEHMNGVAGAFFTPPGLARCCAIEVQGRRILDLCAGIGALAYACERPGIELVCVEINPQYVEVGSAVVPAAKWVNASVFDVDAYRDLGPFDCVISNPPFGAIKAEGFAGRYTGSLFEYRIIELASTLAPFGVFIVPQQSAPFRYSGQRHFEEKEDERARKFREQTGIEMTASCGIDTSVYRDEWHGVSPVCEIVCCEFAQAVTTAATAAEPQLGLFGRVA